MADEIDRAAVARAYGLLWSVPTDGSKNGRRVSKARVLLREQLTRDEMAEGIAAARAVNQG